MRCPKCGYISFDDNETCVSCKKTIKAGDVIKGAVFQIAAPLFLRFEQPEQSRHNRVAVPQVEQEEDFLLSDSQEEENDGIAFSLDTEEMELQAPDQGDGPSMGFELSEPQAGESGDEDIAVDFALDVEEETAASPVTDQGPQFDFGDLDLSDLAPPEPVEQTPQTGIVEEELVLEGISERSMGSTASSTPGGGAALEDLQVDGLDLDRPAQPVQGSVTGKKLLPGVKTGTALDAFDVDLGELFPE